jgi:hypothetical protein
LSHLFNKCNLLITEFFIYFLGLYRPDSGQYSRSPVGFGHTGRVRPDSGEFGQNPAMATGRCPILVAGADSIFRRRNFFVRVKRRKIFSKKLIFLKNDFVKNILRRKSFYFETNKILNFLYKFSYKYYHLNSTTNITIKFWPKYYIQVRSCILLPSLIRRCKSF